MNKQQGFTLIELMIVVAIIAILAAIAIPQYQNYVARSQVTRVMGEAGNLKTAVEDCFNNGKLTIGAASATTCDPGATGSSIQGEAVGNSAPGITLPTGTAVPLITSPLKTGAADVNTIVATFGNRASAKINKATLTWSRSADGTWSCTTNVDAKYAPTGCPSGT